MALMNNFEAWSGSVDSFLEALRSKHLTCLPELFLYAAYTMTGRWLLLLTKYAPFVRVSGDLSCDVSGWLLRMGLLFFKPHTDECHKILISSRFEGIVPLITARMNDDSKETGTGCYRSAVCAIEFTLAKFWMSWRIRPAAIVGHRGMTLRNRFANICSLNPIWTHIQSGWICRPCNS